MLKRLPIIAVAAVVVAVILVAVYYQQRNAVGEGYDIKCVQGSQPSSATDSLTCAVNPSNNAEQGHPSPHWWYILIAWPEGITAWLLLCTLGAILWQSFATDKSATAALLQIQMMKDKERARVEIKALGLELDRISEDFWCIKSSIEFRNVGAGRAYVRLGTGNFEIVVDGIDADPPHANSLDIVDGFIDPTGSPAKESFYFFQPENASLSEYAQKICDGAVRVYITGFIEYETVGTRFHRDFSYAWVGHGSPLNIGAMLTTSDKFSPKTDEERISFGFWSPFTWMTGRPGDNEEYEMEPERKAKKTRKKAN